MNTKQKLLVGYFLSVIVVFVGAIFKIMDFTYLAGNLILWIGGGLTTAIPIIFISLYYRDIIAFFKK